MSNGVKDANIMKIEFEQLLYFKALKMHFTT